MKSVQSGTIIPPSIRAVLGWDSRYSTFSREKCNVAAIPYHLFLTRDNLARFCDKIGAPLDRDPSRVELYVEFANLRDLWHALGQKHDKAPAAANAVRRN
jgi:hypothetical protein